MNQKNVLMIGPARSVKGGMTTVVDNYYNYGLNKKVNLKYIETVNDSNNISKFLKELKGIIEFRKYINDYDIVHIHMASRRSTFRKGKYVRIAKNKGKRVILHIHGAEYKVFYDECNKKQKEYVRNTLNLADKIIVLSEEWENYFRNLVKKEKICVIYNSIVIPKDFVKNLDTKKILFLGRIGKRKGIYDLLDVIERLIKKYPDIKLYVGGDGEINKIKLITEEKKLQDNVIYVGWVSKREKEELLTDCSYFVLPSYNEGMPMSVLEGMAYRNITISTNVGGIPKIIQDKENGMIIHPGDKESLYNNFDRLFEDKELRKKLSANGRKTIEDKFNIEKVINQLIELYK